MCKGLHISSISSQLALGSQPTVEWVLVQYSYSTRRPYYLVPKPSATLNRCSPSDQLVSRTIVSQLCGKT